MLRLEDQQIYQLQLEIADAQKQKIHQECELEKVKFQLAIMEGVRKEVYDTELLDKMDSDDVEGLI